MPKVIELKWKKEPRKVLENLKKSLRNKILRKATKKGATIFRKAMISKLPTKSRKKRGGGSAPYGATGSLKKSITSKVFFWKKIDEIVGKIGPDRNKNYQFGTLSRGRRKGQPRWRRPWKMWWLYEFGTKVRTGRGTMPAKSFLLSSFNQKWPSANRIMLDTVSQEIKKLWSKSWSN